MADGLYVSRDPRHSSRCVAKALVSVLAFFWAASGSWQPRGPGLPLGVAYARSQPRKKEWVKQYPPVDTPDPIVMRELKAPLAYEIWFADRNSVHQAVKELDGLDFAGEPLFVTPSLTPSVVNAQGSFYGSTPEEVREYFEKVGKVVDVESHLDERFGEVRFGNERHAWNAKVELDGTELLGKRLRVELDCGSSDLNKVLVHGLSKEVRRQDLTRYFRQAGRVIFATVHGGKFAKISFSEHKAAVMAIRRLQRWKFDRYQLSVCFPWDSTKDIKHVNVRGMPSDMTADELRELFLPCGDVEDVSFEVELMPPEFCQ